ncbi:MULTISPECIES: hypothetical protein [unclassified Streptomyces]|uniref:hypothetical protein n=1 Tax=unclassified Streptomyces TaxID=2593676 RepID=UPI002E11429C|nr:MULTISPECIES: hypothetical protein [unclassified Streptomyces]WSR22462.1 hypothetical protein OG573_27260 [Streptomyces sp. NBC_01205]
MQALRMKRLFAVSAIGVLMAGGAALGAAGTASAATPTYSVTYVHGGGWDDDGGGHGGYGHGGYDDDDDWGGGYGDCG